MKNSFVIRVYGIYISDRQELLLSDEFVKDRYITKFPGGGLQFGEGTLDCLRREMREETGQEIEITEHFYTTDFFVPSAFDPQVQVISVYYRMVLRGERLFKISVSPFDFDVQAGQTQSFRWIRLNELIKEDLTLPIDQRVAELLRRL